MFTYDELQELLPKKQRSIVTREIVDDINDIAKNPEYGEEFKDNMLSYSTVLANSRYSLNDYVNATKFITLMLLEHHDIDAYRIVFPVKYAELIALGKSRSDISPYSTAYKKTKLVSQILEQTMVPSHVLNAPMYQEALNHSRYLMLNARSETVQQKAAETIMTQLKAPEAAKLEVDISINQGEVVRDNEAFMIELAEKKLELMAMGGNVKDIANMTVDKQEVIDVEVETK